MEIDWKKLAGQLGSLTVFGETSGSDAARRALEIILGEDAMRASVEHYIACRGGSELARSVLWQLRPWSAMLHCYEVFKSARDIGDRRLAVELVRVVADRRALPWIPEFLTDPDLEIQSWGAGVLDQLTFSELVEPEEAEALLLVMERHENGAVREQAERIRGFMGM